MFQFSLKTIYANGKKLIIFESSNMFLQTIFAKKVDNDWEISLMCRIFLNCGKSVCFRSRGISAVRGGRRPPEDRPAPPPKCTWLLQIPFFFLICLSLFPHEPFSFILFYIYSSFTAGDVFQTVLSVLRPMKFPFCYKTYVYIYIYI